MFESCICTELDEPATLLSRRRRVARKSHKCVECGCEIQPGDTYEIDTTVFEDTVSSYKTCVGCVRVRESLFHCGWYYGEIWQDIHEEYCAEGECVCPARKDQER